MADIRIFTEDEKNALRDALNQSITTQQLWTALGTNGPGQCTPNGSKTCKLLSANVFRFYFSEELSQQKEELVLELMSEMLDSGF